MVKPGRTLQQELDDIEHHSATIALLLDVLRIGRDNAMTPRLIAKLDREIVHQEARLAELHARRAALQKQLGGKGRG